MIQRVTGLLGHCRSNNRVNKSYNMVVKMCLNVAYCAEKQKIDICWWGWANCGDDFYQRPAQADMSMSSRSKVEARLASLSEARRPRAARRSLFPAST